MSKETFNKLRLALVAAGLILVWGLGFRAGAARGAGRPVPTNRPRITALVAERDRALAALADSQKRHRIAQRGIEQLVQELAFMKTINESLRREVESCPASVHGDLSSPGRTRQRWVQDPDSRSTEAAIHPSPEGGGNPAGMQ